MAEIFTASNLEKGKTAVLIILLISSARLMIFLADVSSIRYVDVHMRRVYLSSLSSPLLSPQFLLSSSFLSSTFLLSFSLPTTPLSSPFHLYFSLVVSSPLISSLLSLSFVLISPLLLSPFHFSCQIVSSTSLSPVLSFSLVTLSLVLISPLSPPLVLLSPLFLPSCLLLLHQSLLAGDMCDVQDDIAVRSWKEAVVTDIASNGDVSIHFRGWNSTYDEVSTE